MPRQHHGTSHHRRELFGTLESRQLLSALPTDVLFSEAYYRTANPDVAAAISAGTVASGWAHFQASGAREGRNPSADFDEAFYRAKNPDVKAAIEAGNVASGFAHFAASGSWEGRDPSAAFGELAYRRGYEDVAVAFLAGQIPSGFYHFIVAGRAEGRVANPKAGGSLSNAQTGEPLTSAGLAVKAPTLLETLVGRPRPGIDQISLRQWEEDVEKALLAHSPIARETTYYFAVDGNDANPGTRELPKKNLSAAQALINAWTPTAGGLRIHFLNHGRYSLMLPDGSSGGLDAELIVSKPNVTVSADGTEFYYVNDRFALSQNSNFAWTQTAGATYTWQCDMPSWATAMGANGHGLGWVFEDTSIRRTSKPYALAYSPAEVETREGSFYVARGAGANGTDRLYVHIWTDATNYGTYNPTNNRFRLHWIPANEAAVVRLMPGSDGARVNGLDCIGFGVDPVKGKTAGFAVGSYVDGTDIVVITNVSAFYASSKVLVMESNTQAGGATAFMYCQAGFCGPNPGGQVTMNGYSTAGGHSFVAIGNRLYEALPTTGPQSGGGNGSIGGHGNGGTQFAEVLVMDCVAESITGLRFPSGTAFSDVPAPSSRSAWDEYVGIVDNFTVVKGMVGGNANVAYINSFSGAAGTAGIVSGIHINEVFYSVSNVDSGPTVAAWFHNAPHDAWLFNCTIASRGPWAFTWNNASLANSSNIRVYNSIFENLLSVSPANQKYWSANLGAGQAFHNAVWNIATSSNDYGRGYTGDPDVVVLSAPVSPLLAPSPESEAYQSATPGLGGMVVRYDRNWLPRSSMPSMGAVDVDPIILSAPHLPDANFDSKVDAFDLNSLASNWQQTTTSYFTTGDFLGDGGLPDGKVDAMDLNALALYWQYGH